MHHIKKAMKDFRRLNHRLLFNKFKINVKMTKQERQSEIRNNFKKYTLSSVKRIDDIIFRNVLDQKGEVFYQIESDTLYENLDRGRTYPASVILDLLPNFGV